MLDVSACIIVAFTGWIKSTYFPCLKPLLIFLQWEISLVVSYTGTIGTVENRTVANIPHTVEKLCAAANVAEQGLDEVTIKGFTYSRHRPWGKGETLNNKYFSFAYFSFTFNELYMSLTSIGTVIFI